MPAKSGNGLIVGGVPQKRQRFGAPRVRLVPRMTGETLIKPRYAPAGRGGFEL